VSDLIVKSKNVPDREGSVLKVTSGSAGWEYVGFEVLRLAAGEAVGRGTGGEEVCLVPISGTCSVSSASGEWEFGGREGPFDGPPYALYLPPGVDYRVEAAGELELAVCSAPAERGVEPFWLGRRRSRWRGAARGTWSARCVACEVSRREGRPVRVAEIEDEPPAPSRGGATAKQAGDGPK
jgi:5-deoxy-glucuronate isomerase